MNKIVKAVAPYTHPNFSNFKTAPYESWVKSGGQTAKTHYPLRLLRSLAYKYELPSIWENKREVRLRFVSGYSIRFDTYPDYAFYEIIPVIWDCWPPLINNCANFLRKHKVKTAIFTSSQTAERIQMLLPKLRVIIITEGVDLSLYNKGEQINKREIDILEIGRKNGNFFKTPLSLKLNHIKTGNFTRIFKTDEDFRAALANTKITINVPRCDVDKKTAGDIETLTQRYWECMLSRVVMVGRAPKELTNLIGYNPVIDWDGYDATPLVTAIMENISDYQTLVDKNFETALRMASWDLRIKQIIDSLLKEGYRI